VTMATAGTSSRRPLACPRLSRDQPRPRLDAFLPASQPFPTSACLYRQLPTRRFRHTALAITDEASPFALRSTRNHPRRAVRRGAAWPAERQSSCPVRRRAPRALLGAFTAEPSWAAERRRGCPREHGFRRPAGGRSGGGQDARCRPYLRHPVRSSASVRSCGVQRPVGADRSRCAMSTRPVSSVGVRVSGVNLQRQCVPRPLCTDQEVLARGGVTAATGEDGWSRRGRPAVSATALSSARVRAWRSSLAQAVLPARRRPRPRPGRRRRLQAAARRARLADQGSASRARIARQEGGGGQIGGGDYAPWSS
jgi:hypothetical protein